MYDFNNEEEVRATLVRYLLMFRAYFPKLQQSEAGSDTAEGVTSVDSAPAEVTFMDNVAGEREHLQQSGDEIDHNSCLSYLVSMLRHMHKKQIVPDKTLVQRQLLVSYY